MRKRLEHRFSQVTIAFAFAYLFHFWIRKFIYAFKYKILVLKSNDWMLKQKHTLFNCVHMAYGGKRGFSNVFLEEGISLW